MTIEEKAKAYDEVLKQIKECTPDENGFVTIYPNEIFPELAEGDDERIRKEIISYLKRRLKFDSSIPAAIGYWIAWLEKQGEQIDIANKEYWRGYREGKQEVLDKYTELEKQGEQKPWSEEDETIKNNISHIIRQYDKISKRENQPCYYIGDCLLWMQNIKDRVQPKPKQEWSDEDNEHIKSIISTIECSKAQFPNSPAVLEAYNSDLIWLKSLRLHSKWKPTEEQVEALGYAIKLCDGEGEKGRYYLQFLYKLMNDFKAL